MKDLFVAALGKPEGIVLFQLLEATQFTIYLSLIAFIGGGLLGAGITLLRIMPGKTSRKLALGYIWLFQSVPLLMLLFLTGLGAPKLLDVDINPWTAACVSLTLYASAYLSDVWRGAIESVPQGQWEGGMALGIPFFRTLKLVVLPQAIRVALAPTVGFMVQIIKGTSLAYIIGFHDLMAIGKRWANAPIDGTEPFIIFPLMALIYFCLCYPLSLTARRLEARLGKVGTRTPQAG
ncbi:amino acid ABC transporter permease [Cognatishimia maritima]|uniref:Polar amino acid transport system permease protein n=1 Tax=Cognatishimia maritima TaxID=870908 RepID=A0A1M5V124_9RHOB|nr:amino acid ABC transporter permease [Cognatishimia maritima]SHH68844.1 polar amino acid transport system permease protein [Cognatishimia maritima]